MDPSPAVEATVRRWAERLEHAYGRIQRCDVVIELPHRHQRQGHTYSVRVEIAVPERTLVATHDHALDASNEDVYVAIAGAFRAVRRQLQGYAQIRRGDIKQHAPS